MDTIYPVLLGTPPPPSGSGLPIPAPQAGPADLLTARHRTDEIHALLLCLGREVMAVTGRTRAEVLLLDAPGDRRGIAVWAGVATRERPVLQALVHLRPFLPAWSGGAALESITDLPAADPVTDVLRQLGRLLTLTLPIREGDQVVGRITVWSTTDTRAVSGPEINAAMAVVGQAGAALAELRRRHLADTHLVSQSALLSIARLAADRRFTGSTFAEVAAVTRQVIGADSAVISLLRRGGAEVVAVADSRAEGWDRPSDRGTRTPVTGDPAIARALADGGMVLLDDGTPWLGDAGREALRFSGTATRVYLALVHDGTVIGVLRLDFRSPRAVSDDECRVLADLAAQVATTLATIQRQAAFRRAATVDDLTGALRRQPVRARLDAMLTGDAGRSRAVILARLDGVPGINADQGFLAGDRLLRVVANRLRCLAGLSATIGRWNGTEFLIILTGDDMDRAAALVEATAPGMADGTRALPGGVALRMGIAHVPSDGTTADELLEAALATMTPMPTPIVAPASVAPSVAPSVAAVGVPLPPALQGLVRELDRHDQIGLVHADLVATLAARFATSLGLTKDEVEAIAIAGQVLDIGKLLVPAALLRKPGPLTSDERRLVQQHVALGCQMISGVPHEATVIAAIGSHHEWWDETGYPRGIAGDAIPLGGRILALADATAAMALDKPYRRGRMVRDIVTELCRASGTQFDPDLVEPFVVELHRAANDGVLGTVLVQSHGSDTVPRSVAV